MADTLAEMAVFSRVVATGSLSAAARERVEALRRRLGEEHPESLEINMHDVPACQRMKIDRASYEKLIDESEHEIDALRQALGV